MINFLLGSLSAQDVYTIKADSVKLTGCDSTELIIENHSQGVPGFLYNTGRGRTVFKRALGKINDTMYTVGPDTLRVPAPRAWLQGGNAWGATGILGTKDKYNLDFYTSGFQQARLDTSGSLLLGLAANSGFKLDVNGSARILVPGSASRKFIVSGGDSYDIQSIPYYNNAYGVPAGGSLIAFGNIYASIGVNKAVVGNIPVNSLIIGGSSPGHITTLVDYVCNPIFTVDGYGIATINGGYNGIVTGGSVGSATDASTFNFNINGGRGTGAGNTGDIVFSTGTAQPSGTVIHTMTNRWWIKGQTGYLSNTSAATSAIDITGASGYSQLRLRSSYTPSSTTDTNGNTGDFSWDGNYFYVKTPAGWKRSALTTF